MRGTIIALTDDTGDIAETYFHDPFGNVLSTPTIYNPKLFILVEMMFSMTLKLNYIICMQGTMTQKLVDS